MSEKPIYYTDVLDEMKRFDKVKSEADKRKKIEDLQRTLPQGHGSKLNADMVDSYHATDIFEEVSTMIGKIPRRHGGGGGGGTLWYDDIGAPTIVGVDGDYYLNTANGDVYHNTTGVWAVVGNILGGPAGCGDATLANQAIIIADTDELQTDLTDGGRLDLLIDAIKAKTDLIGSGGAVYPIIGGGHVIQITGDDI